MAEEKKQSWWDKFVGASSKVAQAVNPNIIAYAQDNLQKIGGGNLTPTSIMADKETGRLDPKALAMGGGPIMNLLFGPKHQQAAGMELAGDLNAVKAIASGVVAPFRGAPAAPPAPTGNISPYTGKPLPTQPQQFPPNITDLPETKLPYGGLQYNPASRKTLEAVTGAAAPAAGEAAKATLSGGSKLLSGAGILGGVVAAGSMLPKLIDPVAVGHTLLNEITGDAKKNSKAVAAGPQGPDEVKAREAEIEKKTNDEVKDPFAMGIARTTTDQQALVDSLLKEQQSERYIKDRRYGGGMWADQIDSRLQQAQGQAGTSEGIATVYADTQATVKKINNVLDVLETQGGSFANISDLAEAIKKNNEPLYNELVGLLKGVKDADGNDILKANAASGAANLSAIKKQILAVYEAELKKAGNTRLDNPSEFNVAKPLPAIPPASPSVPGNPRPIPTAPAQEDGPSLFQPLTGGGGGLPEIKKAKVPERYLYR